MKHADYYNRKDWYSMGPGSIRDARVLSNKCFKRKFSELEVIFLIVDSAYPLPSWLKKLCAFSSLKRRILIIDYHKGVLLLR